MTGRRVFVLGAARSGKSAHAESLLRDHATVDYIATAAVDPSDEEWAQRIARHRERRPPSWATVETTDLAAVFAAGGPPALVDSVTAWLTSAMDTADVWRGSEGAQRALAEAVDAMVGAWASTQRLVIAVSDEVGGGIVPDSMAGRLFRDALGGLNQRLAASADEVWLVTAGIPQQLR